jgi:hypothetical protein
MHKMANLIYRKIINKVVEHNLVMSVYKFINKQVIYGEIPFQEIKLSTLYSQE